MALERGVEDLGQIVPLVVANTCPVPAGGGDFPDQRLAARAGCRIQHVVHGTRAVRVQFIDQRGADIQPVERAAFRRKRHELRCRVLDDDRAREHFDAEASAELAVHARHLVGDVENDVRLIARGRRRIDFRAPFIVRRQQVQPDAGELGGFGVLARLLFVNGAETAQPV